MTHPRRTGAFTLIELLVVISIIALLVGILLPALGAARNSARAVLCQTHMKNLTTAFVAYATDNQGWWPSWASAGYPGLENTWVPSGSLVNATGDEPYPKDLADGTIYQYTPDYGVFECPSDPWAPQASGLSYSVSYLIYAIPRPAFPQTSVEPAVEILKPEGKYRYPQSDKFRKPSQLIFMVDEGGPINGQFDLGVNDGYFENLDVNVSPAAVSAGFPSFPDLPNAYPGNGDKSKWYHSGGAAFGFADGHGEVRKRDDEEIYSYKQGQLVGKNENRPFFFAGLWDPAGQAPLIAGQK